MGDDAAKALATLPLMRLGTWLPIAAPVSAILVAILAGASPTCLGSDLSVRLDKALQSIPEGGEAGVAVYDLGADSWLYLSNSSQPLSLASTTKLLVSAAAYHELGPRFQFITRMAALGPLKAGSLPGIGIVGGGDPCFDGHFYDDDPDQAFLQWANHCKDIGVTRIDGDVVVDNHLFAGPIRPATYPQDAENLQRWYSAPASAFAWNDNCIEVRILPTVSGHPADVQTRPQCGLVPVRNLTRTVTGKGDSHTSITRDIAANTVTVSGTCAKPGAWFPLAIATDPDLLAGEHLKHLFEQAGIAISGSVRLGAVDLNAGPLLVDLHHDLQPALTLMNQHSQNFYAEQMLRLVGAHHAGEGSIDAGRKSVTEILTKLLGKDADSIALLDGSGLSYENRASASTMARLLIAMARGPYGDLFPATLKSKDSGKARGAVKTGTHAMAYCLVGYIELPGGRRLVFAELLNRGTAKDIGWASKLRETLFKIICDDG